MIKKYNDFLNEKLSDKLSGFKSDDEVYNNLIHMYKRDDITFNHLINKLREINIELSHSEIIELLESELNEHKIDISDIIKYNNNLVLDLTADEIFKFIGFDTGFNTLISFIKYLYDNCKKEIKNNKIIFSYNNKTRIMIYDNKIWFEYDLYLLFEYWFNYKEQQSLNILLQHLMNEYFNTDIKYEIEYF